MTADFRASILARVRSPLGLAAVAAVVVGSALGSTVGAGMGVGMGAVGLHAQARTPGATQATQGTQSLSIAAIYDPAARVNFTGAPATNLTWIDASRYRTTRRGSGGTEWVAVEAASGQATPLFDAARMETAFAALPGMSRSDAAGVAHSGGLVFNRMQTGVLATIADDLYYYDIPTARALRLTTAAGEEEEASFSPDGKAVAFVRAFNLFVVDVASASERALTTDGHAQLLNGKLDWLYQEEIYGRGRFRAYWWSPDSSRLAYLQLDEKPVPEYTVVDHIPYRPDLIVTDYPKAGDPNPTVKLGVVRSSGGAPVWADLSGYGGGEILVVNVDWTPDGAQVVGQVQDREQTWLDLNLFDAATGKPARVLRETTKAWVNENGNPVWLKDGSFLWVSERTGFRHLYQYRRDGTQVRQVTDGRWDMRTLYGVNEATGQFYFASGERRAIGNDVYRAGLNGMGMTRLSRVAGWHRAIFNPAFTQYVDVWSDVTTPTQVRLHREDGSELRVLDANPSPTLAGYRLSTPEFVEVKARDGAMLDAMIIKPVDFDPSRRYPVYQYTYAGPGASSVADRWGGSEYLFHQLIAQQGVIVWILDNRSAGGKGVEAQWPVYGRLGEMELRDLEDGIGWLKQQPYVDPSRVTISGWSYGGFMAAYAMTHSTSWSAGIVGAPVTDWRDYDSVYTERYMKTPQHNPEGYQRTAPRFAAAALHGRMLLLHGTTDDNVHMQNTVQFIYELQKARKSFEMMLYPKSQHGITDPALSLHLRQTMFDFVRRVSSLPAAPATASLAPGSAPAGGR